MKPRAVTQEDADFWSDEDTTYVVGPMMGRHIGAEDIPTVLKGKNSDGVWVIKVAWESDDREHDRGIDVPSHTLWTTFWDGMPATDVVFV